MEQKYLILIAGWMLYYAIHSIAAGTRIKSYFEDLGMSKSTYRKVYVLGSVIGLIAMLIYVSTLNERYLFERNNVLLFLSLVLAAFGAIVIKVAFKNYNARTFLGFGIENPSRRFEVGGILSYIRHPLYSGTILILLGYVLYNPRLSSVLFLIITLLYLVVGIHLEEGKLINEFGDQYREYRSKVPALFPKIKNLF